MKKSLPAWLLAAALLNSCSLLQREPEEEKIPIRNGMEAPFANEVNATNTEGTLNAATPVSDVSPSYEAELSRMSTKIAALETKVDVLTANLERAQLKGSQPVIEGGRPAAAAAFAAEVSEPSPGLDTVAHATKLPSAVKEAEAPSSAVEKDFRSAMDLFQAGQNLEAASQFALLAKKYPRHLLASHSLYWAGEASARGAQWNLAVQNWQDLEKNYPRSAYMPDALAGLARAYEKQGNVARAKSYKDTLLRSFPKAPVSLALNSPSGASVGRAASDEAEESVPTFDEGKAAGGDAGEE